MAKRPSTKQQPATNLGTFFLARNSKLFRPGAEFMLATAKPYKQPEHPAKSTRKVAKRVV